MMKALMVANMIALMVVGALVFPFLHWSASGVLIFVTSLLFFWMQHHIRSERSRNKKY